MCVCVLVRTEHSSTGRPPCLSTLGVRRPKTWVLPSTCGRPLTGPRLQPPPLSPTMHLVSSRPCLPPSACTLLSTLDAPRPSPSPARPLPPRPQNEMERVQLRETVKAYRAELEASEANSAAETEAMRKAHEAEVRTP